MSLITYMLRPECRGSSGTKSSSLLGAFISKAKDLPVVRFAGWAWTGLHVDSLKRQTYSISVRTSLNFVLPHYRSKWPMKHICTMIGSKLCKPNKLRQSAVGNVLSASVAYRTGISGLKFQSKAAESAPRWIIKHRCKCACSDSARVIAEDSQKLHKRSHTFCTVTVCGISGAMKTLSQ
jgi:hypothetical protein